MKGALYLLPDAALLVLLGRMVAVRLHQERPALFVFLLAWFFYSIVALLIFQQRPFDPAQYARTYLGLTLFVWLLGALALWPALARVAESGWPVTLVCAAGFAALFFAHGILARAGAPDVRRTLILTCSIALVAGAAWLAASLGADDPDRILWRGAGAFFLLYGAGAFAARIWPGAALEVAVILLGAAAWTALAIFIAPTGDALINTEKLALSFSEPNRRVVVRAACTALHITPARARALLLLSLSPIVPTPSGAAIHRRRADLTGTPQCLAVQCRNATPQGESAGGGLPAPLCGGARG